MTPWVGFRLQAAIVLIGRRSCTSRAQTGNGSLQVGVYSKMSLSRTAIMASNPTPMARGSTSPWKPAQDPETLQTTDPFEACRGGNSHHLRQAIVGHASILL